MLCMMILLFYVMNLPLYMMYLLLYMMNNIMFLVLCLQSFFLLFFLCLDGTVEIGEAGWKQRQSED